MLPQELGCGSGMTCWRRLRDWQLAGVWDLIHFAVLDWLARHGRIDWSRAVVDSCSVRAVYAGEQTGPHLYVRPLDRADATLVRGTDGAEGPFFSPDGQHLGFYAASQLKQVALDGGAPVKICDAVGPRGAAWGPDGTIVFTPGGNDPLWRVPVSGATPERITTRDTEHHERTDRFPTILPDGRTVLFVAATTDISSYADAQIIAQPIAGGMRKVVVQGGTSPQFSMGQLVYNRGDALVAVPFDVRRLEVTGRPVVVATDVAWSAIFAVTHAALARDGTLAYLPGGETGTRKKIVWVDRAGQRTAVTDATGFYADVRVSPDGTRLLLWNQAANDMLLVYDLARHRSTRLPARQRVRWGVDARWSPCDRRLGCHSGVSGSRWVRRR
jgi:Tol biopolymer transport system component